MLEWLKRHAWKACVPLKGIRSSNLLLSASFFYSAMKRILILFAALALFASQAVAQTAYVNGTAPRYKELKQTYNFRDYDSRTGGPYSVGWSEAGGFFFPGVPQLVMGEPVKGLVFLGSEVVLVAIARGGAQVFSDNVTTDADGNVTGYIDEAAAKTGAAIFLVSLAADLGLCIWSSIDARHVAQVKNMYYNDKTLSAKIAPTVSYTPTPNGYQFVPGMTLALKF